MCSRQAPRSCTPTSTRSSPRSSSETIRGCAAAPRSSGRGRDGGELRGQGLRGAGKQWAAPKHDACARTRSWSSPDSRPTSREQGGVRRLPANRAGRRGTVDGGGVPRRPGDAADLGFSIRDRGAAAARGVGSRSVCASPSALPPPRRSRRWRGRREAGRSAGGAGRPRAGIPAPAPRGEDGEWARPRPAGCTTAEL